MKGKDKCEILKKIRSDFAQKNGIDYSPSECNHDGDCNGVCPKCEEEADMLLKEVKDDGIISIDISPIDGSSLSDDLLLFDREHLIEIKDAETTDGIIDVIDIDDEICGDIIIGDNENEDLIEIAEEEISIDYLTKDESKDDDYV